MIKNLMPCDLSDKGFIMGEDLIEYFLAALLSAQTEKHAICGDAFRECGEINLFFFLFGWHCDFNFLKLYNSI